LAPVPRARRPAEIEASGKAGAARGATPRRRATMPATMPAMMLATMLATMFAMMGAMTRIRMAKREGVPGRPSRPGPMQRGRPGGCAPAAPIRRR
jgi:hypothetical protein